MLESEGDKQALINRAEAEKSEVILRSEAAKEDSINRATGAALRLHHGILDVAHAACQAVLRVWVHQYLHSDKSWPLPAMGDKWFCSFLLSCGATSCLGGGTCCALWQCLGLRCAMLAVLAKW